MDFINQKFRMMILNVVAIAIIAFVDNSEGKNVWTGLVGKWSLNGTDAFFPLPEYIKAAKYQGWTQVSGVGAPDDVLPLCYYDDPRIVLLFSKQTDKVIGIQVGFSVSDAKRSGIPIDYGANRGLTKKTLNSCDYYTGTALFRQDEDNDSRRLWFEVNGKLEEIPTKAELVTLKTPYYLKRCIKWMGLHYYQINSTTDCSQLFPWFLLRVNQNVMGFGLQLPGPSSSGPKRKWFEETPPGAGALVQTLVPDAPSCLVELADKYGLFAFHVYLIKDPLDIVCTDECTAAYSNDDCDESSNDEHKRSKRATGSGNVC